MDSPIDILNLVDAGVDPGFAASLAGLSLAAAAFYGPFAERVLKDTRTQILKIQSDIAKGETRGYLEQPENEKRLADLKKIEKSTTSAQTGLIKAFQIFVGFVAYTISIDSVLDMDSAELIFGQSFVPQSIDVAISSALLSWAGFHLWTGAKGIADYFEVDFEDEKKRVENFLISTGRTLEEMKNESKKET